MPYLFFHKLCFQTIHARIYKTLSFSPNLSFSQIPNADFDFLERRGERILKPGKKKYGQLHEDRPAAWRLSAAIQCAATKWPEARKLLHIARAAADAEDSSQSEDERNNHGPNFIVPRLTAPVNGNGQASGGEPSWNYSLVRMRAGENGWEPESSDDEEIPDPNPDPSTEIRKPRRFSRPPQTDLDSDDDQEVPDPDGESSSSIMQNRRDDNKARSKSPSRPSTRSPSGKLTIKLEVPATDKGKGKAPAKEMSGPAPAEDEEMEGSELY